MIRLLGLTLAALGAVTVTTMFALFFVKLGRHFNERRVAFRSAVYISTLGEILSRGMMPTQDLSAWAHDTAFHETLIDFFNLVAGDERQTLIELTEHLDMLRRFHRGLGAKRSESERLRSVSALAVIAADESRPYLLEALRDPITEVRIEAAAGLSVIGAEEDLRAILTAMEQEDRWAAERMADAIVRFGPTAVPVLSNYVLIGEQPPLVAARHVTTAVRCLGQIGDLRGETAILTALHGDDPIQRLKAAEALKQPWGDRSARALVGVLTDEDWRVRAQAATALAAYDYLPAVPALAAALNDEAWWVRQNAATTLGKIEGGVDALFDALDLTDPYAADAAKSQLQAGGHFDDFTPSPAPSHLQLVQSNVG